MGIALRPITPRGKGPILVRYYRTSVLHFTRLAIDAAARERGVLRHDPLDRLSRYGLKYQGGWFFDLCK